MYKKNGMYNFELPITRWKEEVDKASKVCPKCNVKLVEIDYKETIAHYIGDHRIEAIAYVPKGECPRCGQEWESEEGGSYRNEALKLAVSDFWRDENIASMETIRTLKMVAKKMLDKKGKHKSKKVAEAFGRWICGCDYW